MRVGGESWHAPRPVRNYCCSAWAGSFVHDPDRLARFQREAKVLASLNHPNIAHFHGLEESNGVRALVMELTRRQSVLGEPRADGHGSNRLFSWREREPLTWMVGPDPQETISKLFRNLRIGPMLT